jgi:hypothetical protein
MFQPQNKAHGIIAFFTRTRPEFKTIKTIRSAAEGDSRRYCPAADRNGWDHGTPELREHLPAVGHRPGVEKGILRLEDLDRRFRWSTRHKESGDSGGMVTTGQRLRFILFPGHGV